MQVALRERDLDAVLGQLIFQRPEIRGASTCRTASTLPVHPDEQEEVQAVVAVLHEPDVRLAAAHVSERVGHMLAGLDSGLFYDFLVGAVGHAERNSYPQDVLAERPVGELRRDELGVRHDDIDIVVRVDQRAADVDGFYSSREARVELDIVTDTQGSLEQDDQPRDEVVDDRLQAETDTDGERTRDDGEICEVEADRRQCDQRGYDDDRVVREPAQRVQRCLRTHRFLAAHAVDAHAYAA